MLNVGDLDNPDELRAAIQLCEQQPTAMYVVSLEGFASHLEDMPRLSVRDIESVALMRTETSTSSKKLMNK